MRQSLRPLLLIALGTLIVTVNAVPAGAGSLITIDPAAAIAPATVTVTVTDPACAPPMAAGLFQGGTEVSEEAFVEGNGPTLALPIPADTPPGGYQIIVFCTDPDTGPLVAFAELPFEVLAPTDPLQPPVETVVPLPAPAPSPVSAAPTFTG